MSQQLCFRRLSRLRHIFVELRSYAEHLDTLADEVEMPPEACLAIKELKPQVDLTVDTVCLGAALRLADIPASPTTGPRMLRFDRSCEGERRSI